MSNLGQSILDICSGLADSISKMVYAPRMITYMEIHSHCHQLMRNSKQKDAHMFNILSFAISRAAYTLIERNESSIEACRVVFDRRVSSLQNPLSMWLMQAVSRHPLSIIETIAAESWRLALQRVAADRKRVLVQAGFIAEHASHVTGLSMM